MLIIERVMDSSLSQIKPGDQLLSYNGIELSDEQSLKHAIWRFKGEKDAPAKVRLLRGDRKGEVEVPGGPLDLIFQQPKHEPIPELEPEPEVEAEPESSVIGAIAGWGGHEEKPRHESSESEAVAGKTNAFGLGPSGDVIQVFPNPLKARADDDIETRYPAARAVCAFIGGAGWLVFAIGALAILAALFSRGSGSDAFVFSIGAAAAWAGLTTALLGQVSAAVLDIADNSRETRRMTALMLEKNDE